MAIRLHELYTGLALGVHVQTTLMDVIAGRKTQGEICGEILVNGYPKVQETWARVVGYVEQMDIHSPQVCSSLVHAACPIVLNSMRGTRL